MVILIVAPIFFLSSLFYWQYKTSQKPQTPPLEEIKTVEAPISKNQVQLYNVDSIAIQLLRDLRTYSNIEMGAIYSDNFTLVGQDLPYQFENQTSGITLSEITSLKYPYGKPRLSEIYKSPSATIKNKLIFSKYEIDVPLIHSSLSDFYKKNDTGKLDFSKIIEEKKEDIYLKNYQSVGVQRLLGDGVVRLAYSPHPGELGNSFIVGHSSNYSSVISKYNFVFKDLVNQQPIGEIFTIYDSLGRKLDFKVFEAIEVGSQNLNQAYINYLDKRVVTLQSSILERVNGKNEPTKRWLIRGELII